MHKAILASSSKTLVALAQATYHFGNYFLEVRHDLMLGQAMLFTAKINVIFAIIESAHQIMLE